MAEGLLRKYLKDAGKGNIEIRSAGIRAIDGFLPTNETLDVMKREGIDMSYFASRGLTDDMIRKADLILTMEGLHKEEVIKRIPAASSKTFLLKEFGVTGKSEDITHPGISDPISRPIEYYEASLAEIKKEVERIMKLL